MSETGPHAVITGGDGTLARAVAAELPTHGFVVDAPGRNRLDVRCADSVHEYFTGREVDLLVCNAGITRDHLLTHLTESDWDDLWAVNYSGALACAEAVRESMQPRGGGDIVFISSFSAKHPPLGQSGYASAKAALLGLTSDLAVRYGPDNIRVNAILPGFLESRMTASVSSERRQQVLDHHTLGRFNEASAVARFIRFLHLELPHTSGQVFQLDSRLDQW